MTHANHVYEDVGSFPVKTVHHFFGPHKSDANHHFTISVLDQYIDMGTRERVFNSFENFVKVCDGTETWTKTGCSKCSKDFDLS